MSPRDASLIQAKNIWFSGIANHEWIRPKTYLYNSELAQYDNQTLEATLIQQNASNIYLSFVNDNQQHEFDKVWQTDTKQYLTDTSTDNKKTVKAQNPHVLSKLPMTASLLTSIIKCPYKTYAEKIMKIQRPKDASFLHNAAQRGELLHLCMQTIWQELTCKNTLVNISNKRLQSLIHESITNSITKLDIQWLDIIIETEKKILNSRIHAVLEYEKQRDDFKVISIEKPFTIHCKEHKVTGVIDRVDEIANGQKIIIDYKTGQASISNWLFENISEPQMPIYALTLPADEVAGLAYFMLKKDNTKLIGITKDKNLCKELTTYTKWAPDCLSWSQIWEKWTVDLAKLMEKRYQPPIVKPFNKQICQNCHLHSLCRINDMEIL